MDTIVGQIVEVRGLAVKAKFFQLLPPYLFSNGKREISPRINGFVKTRVGLDVVVCQVIGEYSQIDEKSDINHFLDLKVCGYFENGKFIQGLRMLPIVSANISLFDENDFEGMYCIGGDETISLGHDLFDDSKLIKADPNKLIPSHIGIFGNTGSGKSNTLTKILVEYNSLIKKHSTNCGKFLIIDFNSEYSNDAICPKDEKTIYKLETRKSGKDKIPLDFESLTEDDFCIFLAATEKTQTPVVKRAYKNFKSKKDEAKDYYKKAVISTIREGKRSLFFSIRYALGDYLSGVSNFYYHSQQMAFYYKDKEEKIFPDQGEKFAEVLGKIKVSVPEDPLNRFLFELYAASATESQNGTFEDFLTPLLSRADKLFSDFRKVFDFSGKFQKIFQEKNICVVQLSRVNRDMQEIVPAIIADSIFNRLEKMKKGEETPKQVINLVVDEAHRILSDDDKGVSTHENTMKVFGRVIKEGRKFGMFLCVASQRPSDISPTIISQLHNYFIHKLVNPQDIERIRKAVAYMDNNSLDLITILAPGECIVSGTAFQMPTFIYVDRVDKAYRPTSADVVLIGENGLFENQNHNIDNFELDDPDQDEEEK